MAPHARVPERRAARLAARRRRHLAGGLAVALCVAGCGASPVEEAVRSARPYVVDEVVLKGVTRFDEETLLSYLNLGETSPWPWGETARYGPALIKTDSQRVVQLYAAFGFHEARVVDLRIEPAPGGEEARVVLEVEEGPQTTVQSVDLTGEPPPDIAPPLKVGAPFEIEGLQAAESRLRADLQDAGHGRVQVDGRAEVDRDARAAKVTFEVHPGPRLTIDRVVLEGLDAVPEYLVQREVEFIEGQPYRPAMVDRVEQQVYAMDVFATVVAKLPDEAPPDGRVPLTVQVREREPDDLKLGVGFGFQPERWEERVTAVYRHRNLFGNLTRLRLTVRAGWAQLPTPWNVDTHGPLVSVAPTFEKKGWLEPQLLWTLAPAFDLGIEPGYQFDRTRVQVGVSRFFFGHLRLSLRHTVEFFDFFDIDDALDDNRTALGLDFRDPYLLSYPTVDARLFLTDDLFDPENGVELGVTYDLAGGVFQGDYDFHRLTPSIAAWWTVHPRLQLAARAETGLIRPYGDRPGAPISLKYKLGGATTVRGWGAERLSPQLFDCEPGNCKGIPIGGFTQVLGNLELRFKVFGPLALATFLDVGDVQADELTWRVDDWNYASGGGLRVDTPIGLLRVDVGVRLNTPARFEQEERWALHLALGDPF
ncbi:MAG: BamA/TamA family outer membrane protein [Myxococcales bacterium]|nr:BamA/TamA family outer membrane protein [Myxococcales bacterium]